MIVADVPASTYFGLPVVIIACVATFIAVVVGAALALRPSSRATGLRILRVALYSVPFEIGLLLLVLALDTPR